MFRVIGEGGMDVQSGRQVHIVIHRRLKYGRRNSIILNSFLENSMSAQRYGVHP